MKIENLEQLPSKVSELISTLLPDNKIWAFDAQMGAGKTTIIREICRQLNVTDNVTSPTFSIINEYHTSSGEMIYHFDFYRINNINEALSIGVSEYFDSGNLCLIEWCRIVEPILPQKYVKISIEQQEDNSRVVGWEMINNKK